MLSTHSTTKGLSMTTHDPYAPGYDDPCPGELDREADDAATIIGPSREDALATDAAEILLDIYSDTTRSEREAGRQWYPDSYRLARRMARASGVTVSVAAGVLAAYSQNTSWKGNVTLARNALAGRVVGLTNVRAEVNAIIAGGRPEEELLAHGVTAPKRVNFYRNIMLRDDHATVDRWAARALGEDGPRVLARSGGYEVIAGAYRRAAAMAGESTSAMQAIVWIATRGSGA